MKKISVNIISGFLGSGKTSAIIRLLAQKNPDESWAIVVNEFGKISIDGQTLRSESASGSVFDISGGCICCSVRMYLAENLKIIIESGKYQRIVIEPSGLGGIDMVTEIVESKPELQLIPVICMVDLTVIENQRLQMNFIYRNQISRAEWIVFSKTDLLPETELQDRIRKFKSQFPEKAHCLLGQHLSPAQLDMDFRNKDTLNDQFIFAYKTLLTDQNFEEKHYQFGLETVFDSGKLTAFFQDYPEIFRSKGHIQTESGWMLLNFTLSGADFETCIPKNRGELVIIAGKSEKNPFPDFQEKMKALLI